MESRKDAAAADNAEDKKEDASEYNSKYDRGEASLQETCKL